MSVCFWKRLLLDRVHLTLKIHDMEYYGVLLGQLKEMVEMQKQIVPMGAIKLNSKGYRTWINYYPRKKNGCIANIEVGTVDPKNRYVRLALYPPKFQGNDLASLKDQLGIFLGGGSDFYGFMLAEARVSYIELAADSFTLLRPNLIPFRRRAQHSSVYLEKDGSYGSVYLGSVNSPLRFCVYDKAKQLKDKNLPGAGQHAVRTRIEARLRNTNLKYSELFDKLESPFEDFEIADAKKARQLTDCTAWHGFLDICESHGSAAALKACNKQIRKQRVEMLRQCSEPHWKPGFIWGGLDHALRVIAL